LVVIMFELSGVSKRYGPTHALRGVDLAIEPGRTTVLIGQSGCGKSTLLRVMIGLLRPDAGEVRFDGQIVDDDNALELRRRMGYVIQEGGLFPHLSARWRVTSARTKAGSRSASSGCSIGRGFRPRPSIVSRSSSPAESNSASA
jgi:osmoprotectant transport system ATP-binding protein